MGRENSKGASKRPTSFGFTTTLWTEVLEAPDNDKALSKLCGRYWYPLYAFLRRSGMPPHEAEDLTQGFFVHLLSKQGLRRVRREYGKFRSFLLASLKNFVADQRDRSMAAKRSPDQPLVEIDALNAESLYRLEPVEQMNPETLFERRWALTLIEDALATLESEFVTNGRAEAFQTLLPFLSGQEECLSHREVAAKLSLSEGAARVMVHRMRERYRKLLRMAIAETLDTSEDVEDEMRHLFDVLRKK